MFVESVLVKVVFSVFSQREYNLSSARCDFEGPTLDCVAVRSNFVVCSPRSDLCVYRKRYISKPLSCLNRCVSPKLRLKKQDDLGVVKSSPV